VSGTLTGDYSCSHLCTPVFRPEFVTFPQVRALMGSKVPLG